MQPLLLTKGLRLFQYCRITSYNVCYTKLLRHSLSAGGKRIRPILMIEFYKMCGGTKNIVPVASAIEMIHTFSLIHDDLPCMDNDDFRRGKPSCHKAFGEAIALLAGDALATLPYEIIAEEAINGNISMSVAVKLIKELTNAVGTNGMIGGQVIVITSYSIHYTKLYDSLIVTFALMLIISTTIIMLMGLNVV